MIRKMICIAVWAWMCACCEKNDGGGYIVSLRWRGGGPGGGPVFF